MNAPRPAFRNIKLEYVDDTNGNNKNLLEAGNIQGAYFYNSYPTFSTSYIIVSVAGTIFTIEIIASKGYVRKLFTGNDPVFTHAWFDQAFEWLAIQDGSAKPILWDGTNPARRAVDGEMPTGSVMASIHGRWAVASSDGTNQIAVGDIVYGNDATTTSDIIKFTEIEYWAEGGAFGAPVNIGDITGLYSMPYLDTGTGQNELVALGTKGAVSIDLSKPRTEWLNSSILRISLVGGGCVSSHSMTGMNGELFFRGQEGVRAFRNARAEFQQSWKQTPISEDVRQWLSYDSQPLLQYASQASWNNLLLTTTRPQIQSPNNRFAGHHRYHLGFVVMDAAPASNTLREGSPIWQGMWTGIRPICFVTGMVRNWDRCFAFSFDCDGQNRLYEIVPQEFQDSWDGNRVKIQSSYTTGSLGVIERVANNFTLKKLGGGEISLSEVREQVDITIKQRPDGSPCYLEMDQKSVGCDCKPGDCGQSFTRPNYAHRKFSNKKQCIPGTDKTADFLFTTQAKIEMTGWAKVDRMRLSFVRPPEESPATNCDVDACGQIQCCEEDFYCIANGEGPDVPFIERPSDVPLYEATATVTVNCQMGTIGTPVTITDSATSEISFDDAYQKALTAATFEANAALVCIPCDPFVVDAFISNNETRDLSPYFVAGFMTGSAPGIPWRLIEIVSGIEYASGIVNNTGTLTVVWVLPGYSTYFDPITFQFIDGGLTDAYMALEIGCNAGGEATWPAVPDYFSP